MKTNIIHCGNCVQVMRDRIPDNSIDLTVTSPPYDVMDEDYNLTPTLRDYNGYTLNFADLAGELWRVTKPGGVVVWVVGDATIDGSETGTSFRQALYFMGLGFNLHDTMIWNKGGFTSPESNRYPPVFEFMFILTKAAPKTFNGIADRKNKKSVKTLVKPTKAAKNGTRERVSGIDNKSYRRVGIRFNVWDISSEASNLRRTSHPAQYPEALARDHIISWSNPNDIVLDPMTGSGTTLKMAKEFGRQWVGIDISQEYCDLAQRRVDGARVPFPEMVEVKEPEPVQLEIEALQENKTGV